MSNYYRQRAFNQYCADRDKNKVKLSEVLELNDDGSIKPVVSSKTIGVSILFSISLIQFKIFDVS